MTSAVVSALVLGVYLSPYCTLRYLGLHSKKYFVLCKYARRKSLSDVGRSVSSARRGLQCREFLVSDERRTTNDGRIGQLRETNFSFFGPTNDAVTKVPELRPFSIVFQCRISLSANKFTASEAPAPARRARSRAPRYCQPTTKRRRYKPLKYPPQNPRLYLGIVCRYRRLP